MNHKDQIKAVCLKVLKETDQITDAVPAIIKALEHIQAQHAAANFAGKRHEWRKDISQGWLIQCYKGYEAADGRNWVIYLRWKFSERWRAELVECEPNTDFKIEWRNFTTGDFWPCYELPLPALDYENDIEEALTAAVSLAEIKLVEMQETKEGATK